MHIWARNTGKRIAVRFPPQGRYLLVQAGKQLEHLTGGLVKAGFHEVVVNASTVETIERRKIELPERPLVRISSTFFWHLSSDYDLSPIPSLARKTKELRLADKNLGSAAAEDDVDAHRNVVRKGRIVEQAGGEVEQDLHAPARDGHLGLLQPR